MATPIEIQTELVIEKIRLDAKARKELDDMYSDYISKGGSKTKQQFEKYAARQGYTDVGEKAEMTIDQKLRAGFANPLIFALEGVKKVLEVGIKNSKIMQTVQQTIAKALGLLVDLILLPFLPLIVWALIKLFQAVVALGKAWDSFVKATGLGGKLPEMPTSTNPDGTSKPKVQQITEWAKYINDLLGLWLDFVKNLGITFLYGLTEIIINVGKWLWDLGWEIGTKLADIVWENFSKPLGLAIKGVRQWLVDLDSTFKYYFDMYSKQILGFLNGILPAFQNTIDSVWKTITEKFSGLAGFFDPIITKITDIKDALFKFLDDTIGKLSGAVQNPVGWASGAIGGIFKGLPFAADGGSVTQTGLAVIHKGETITPAGAGQQMVVNIYGTYQNDEDLYKKFMDRMRKDQWRLNV